MSDEAVLLVSHGTVDRSRRPRRRSSTNIRRGHPAPPELVAELRRRYEADRRRRRSTRSTREVASEARGAPRRAASRRRIACGTRIVEGRPRASSGAEGVRRASRSCRSRSTRRTSTPRTRRRAAEGTGVEVACAPNWGERADLLRGVRDAHRRGRRGDRRRRARTTRRHDRAQPPAVGRRARRPLRARGSRRGRGHRVARSRARSVRQRHVVVAFQSQGMAGAAPVEWLGPDLARRRSTRRDGARRRARRPRADRLSRRSRRDALRPRHRGARDGCASAGCPVRARASLNADDDFVDVLVEVARPLLAPVS